MVNRLVRFVYRLLVGISGRFWATLIAGRNNPSIREALEELFKYLHQKSGKYYLFDSKVELNYSDRDILAFGRKPKNFGNLCIIIQGPVNHIKSFVQETVDFYLREFPDSLIVLSSWEGEVNNLDFAGRENVVVKLSNLPNNRGYSNINYQIFSTRIGIQVAKEMGRRITIKSRTDQRFTNVQTLKKLYCDIENEAHYLHDRIVILSLNTFLLRLFGASDMFQMGLTSVLDKFWEIDLDPRSKELLQEKLDAITTLRDYAKLLVCESYLTYHYALKRRSNVQLTFNDWLDSLRLDFVIVERRDIGVVWPKYSFDYGRWEPRESWFHLYEVSLLDWLRINENPEDYMQHEYLLDQKINF